MIGKRTRLGIGLRFGCDYGGGLGGGVRGGGGVFGIGIGMA